MKGKLNHLKTYILGFFFVGMGIFLDQYTKFLAVTYLKEKAFPIIEGVFELQYLENRGAAFGVLQNQKWFFLVIGCVLLILAALFYVRMPQTKRLVPLRICILFIAAGAIGNMIDRIRCSYVIDFLYIKLIDFPIFNVADVFVTFSTAFLILLFLFYYKEEEMDELFRIIFHKERHEQESGL